MGIKMVWTISYTFLCHNVSIPRWSLIMFLIYWYTSKTQLQESQLSQYDGVSSLPCFLQCNTVTFYITSLHVRPHGFLHNTSHELFPTDHMVGIFPNCHKICILCPIVHDWHVT